MTYRDAATANSYFNTYVFYTLYAEVAPQVKIRSLELAQEAYKEYRKIMPNEDIETINAKAKAVRKKFLKEGVKI